MCSFHIYYLLFIEWQFFFSEHLGKKLEDYVAKLPVNVKVLRTGKRIGLIRARLKGILIII